MHQVLVSNSGNSPRTRDSVIHYTIYRYGSEAQILAEQTTRTRDTNHPPHPRYSSRYSSRYTKTLSCYRYPNTQAPESNHPEASTRKQTPESKHPKASTRKQAPESKHHPLAQKQIIPIFCTHTAHTLRNLLLPVFQCRVNWG